MEDLATSRQLNYLAYLVKGFEAPEGLTKKAASIMIGKALKEAKGSSKKDDGKKTEAKKKPATVNKYGIKAGDVFAFSFGYDATLYEFFKVLRIVSATSVEIAQIGTRRVEGSNSAMDWKVQPDSENVLKSSMWYEGEKALKRIVPAYGNRPSISFGDGYYRAYQINPDEVFSEDDYH